jgi:hypothetical protein
MFDYKTYTGIGSRKTPGKILGLMSILAFNLAKEGWILRSGCAPGADTAFENGALAALSSLQDVSKPELYLPWEGFENRKRAYVTRTDPQPEAYEIAEKYHPRWNQLSSAAKLFHSRNVHQVLGYDVTQPQLSSFVICWTPEAKSGGGTGQALRIAKGYGISEIYDLANPYDLETVAKFLR